MTTLFHYIEFNTIYELVLANNHHLYAIYDLRRDNLDILVKALTQFYAYTFGTTVLVNKYIAVIRADEFLHRLIRDDEGVRFAQTDGRRHVHTRTQEVPGVRDDDLALEGMGRGVDGRIYHGKV